MAPETNGGVPLKVVLIGNYPNDRQQSMQRFAALLHAELMERGVSVECLRPESCLGRLAPRPNGIGKLLGYVDKYVVFPWRLKRRLKKHRESGENAVFHICDHSNAPYLKYLRDVPHLVTCHDLLAIRSAKGEMPDNPTRWSGRLYQRMIVAGLAHSRAIVCVSEATRRDVLRLGAGWKATIVRTIYNGLNYSYRPMEAAQAERRLQDAGLTPGMRFILHVGKNNWYKNRLGVLRIYHQLRTWMPDAPQLIMIGPPFTPAMEAYAAQQQMRASVSAIGEVDAEDLRALYSKAELMLFPSLYEGFGWPIIEAQACGCEVVASDRAPMNEIGGSAAAYIDPEQEEEAARVLLGILRRSPGERSDERQKACANAMRFKTSTMIDGYVRLYSELMGLGGGGGVTEGVAPLSAVPADSEPTLTGR